MKAFKFRMTQPELWDDTVTGYGETEEEARIEAQAGFPPEAVGECLGEVPLPEVKTDFGENGPQPGTAAYTAFIMAQIYPDEDWDRWKEDVKEGRQL